MKSLRWTFSFGLTFNLVKDVWANLWDLNCNPPHRKIAYLLIVILVGIKMEKTPRVRISLGILAAFMLGAAFVACNKEKPAVEPPQNKASEATPAPPEMNSGAKASEQFPVFSRDSMIKVVSGYAASLGTTRAKIPADLGKPLSTKTEAYGESKGDVLTRIVYPGAIYEFVTFKGSKDEDLRSVSLMDTNRAFLGALRIGHTSKKQLFETLGFPDLVINDTTTENISGEYSRGATAEYKDTAIFSYTPDESDDGTWFYLKRDTVVKINWYHNLN